MRGRKKDFVACVHCRQMKLACDGPRNFPAACSRCTKAGRLCSVDPGFRRVKKREKFKEVERELREIKQSLRTGDEHDQDVEGASHTDTSTLTALPSSILPQPEALETAPTGRTIGGIHLLPNLQQDLITEFYEDYHPFCPILPHPRAFLGYAELCPLLLYIVLVTALRGKPEHNELFLALVDTVRTMSYELMRPEFVSLQTMQAFLLLCYWPLPYSKRIDDPTHSFIALATHIGYSLGMHRAPRYAKDFDNKLSVDGNMEVCRRITWVVCFITNVSATSQLGLPTSIRLDRGLLEILAAKPTWLPETLFYQLHVSRQAFNMNLTFEDFEHFLKDNPADSSPIIRAFDMEMRSLESRFSLSWSPGDYIFFLGCRMMLYTIALTMVSDTLEESNVVSTTIESPCYWVVQTYITAISTIRTAVSIQDTIFNSPVRMHKLLINAICYLVLLKCSRFQDLVDNSTLSNGIRQGWEVLRGLSITPNDFTTRACSICERLSRYSDDLKPEERTKGLLVLKSRMGANIAFSTALRAREWSRQTQGDTSSTEINDGEEPADAFSIEDLSLFADINWEDLFPVLGT
ncbi:uncharacterized protein TRUGW13939_07437 [Talaromyces rugulosus]|uniref:Zn(2)-C6 fungal-type domain-containing protein n=1 Tax=Talaromyces rugulosus TaxID=121627 RepID=A0A7H8R1Q6_TALRU|nr:uncharacterized protein TRUGW13939_07437 [Talaromyces rugulosus]QKX60294.1 hypothetical protein TRUGW13939_07437 [Talaromyces rugulosus]